MANQEQLDILRQGVKVWNAWRDETDEIRIDLSGADLDNAQLNDVLLHDAILNDIDLNNARLNGAQLSRAILSGAHLSGAHLINTKLTNADLTNADFLNAILFGSDFRGAHLNGAKLTNADLGGAHLDSANLSHANFTQADLTFADLRFANFQSANLHNTVLIHADLSNAEFDRTVVGNVYLGTTNGLEMARHNGPSSIGIDTIVRSDGKIPEIFLRGAGVPSSIIEAIPSLLGSLKPIDHYSCFISYSSKDDAFARRLYADLQSQNVRCWFAPEDLKWGDKIRTGIDEAIRIHDKLLLVLSGNSVESAWVEKEVETAFDKEAKSGKLVLFPVRLDDAVMETGQAWTADIRRMRNIGDFTGWKDHDAYQKAFERLMRDLKAASQ